MPKVFRELWELSADAGLDQTALVDYLVEGRTQRGQAPFTRRAAENLLRIFDETMRYARLRTVEPAGDDWTTEHITDEAGQAILSAIGGDPAASATSSSAIFSTSRSEDCSRASHTSTRQRARRRATRELAPVRGNGQMGER